MGRGIRIPRPRKPYRPAEVKWWDAAYHNEETSGMATMLTVGYFIFSGKDPGSGNRVVRLSSDLDDGEGREPFHVIPVAHIIDFRLLAPEVAG